MGGVTLKREFKEIPIALVKSPSKASRQIFEDIEELAKTIKMHGLLEPILVMKMKAKYGFEVVCGERRLRACTEAGLEKIPCLILNGEMKQEDILQMQLVENIHRADLKVFEEIRIVETLREKFNFSHEEIANKIGFSSATVSNYLLIAKGLPEKYLRMITRGDKHSLYKLTVTKALLLVRAKLPPEKLKRIVKSITTKGLTRANLSKMLATSQNEKIKRVVASRTYWKELTRSLREFASYWSDYAVLKENEDVKQFHLTLEVTMPKDLRQPKT